MTFAVPQSKKSIKQNRFEFEIEGTTFEVPLLKFAPVAAAEAFEQGQEVKGLLLMCENDAARDAVRDLDGEQFGALMEAWQKASGVEAGESPASSNS